MQRQDIREEMQRSPELFEIFKGLLFPEGIEFCNPDFLVCEEKDARAGKVFDDDSVKFPDEASVVVAWLQAEKVLKENAIREKYKAMMEAVAKPYSEIERESWPKQEAAWREYESAKTVAPFIQILANARGFRAEDIFEHIGKKVELYENTIFRLLGEQGKEIDEL